MKHLKKEFQTITKEFNVLTKKTKELTDKLKKKAFEQLEKAQGAVTPEAAARRTADALRALTNTTQRMIKSVEKFEKEQAARKTKAKTKAKPVRKASAGKKPAPKKKPAAMTASDRVLQIIKRSKKGVDVPTLVKKSGLEDKKVRNIVFRAVKNGKIKRTGRGIYAGA